VASNCGFPSPDVRLAQTIPHINPRMRVLLIAPNFDRTVAGESWCTYKWVEGISERCDTTVLTTHPKHWDASRSPTAARAVVNWSYTPFKGQFARLQHELKPQYFTFYLRARRWIKSRIKEGFRFDLVHQINPVAIRYPSPAAGLGLKYILGPHAGSLITPRGFQEECKDRQWYRKLRYLDQWRVGHDPILRRSFSEAALVLGVAPYMRDLLAPASIRRFELMTETGPAEIVREPKTISAACKPLRLLFVGRVIRTKGVIDAIRAVAIARPKAPLVLDIIGTGDMLEDCRAEAQRLGVADIVTLHGRKSREEVFDWYRKSDVFLFPSFREPSGTVVFEALGFGLPVITSTLGGPGYVVTPTCGMLVEPRDPAQFAAGLASALQTLAADRALAEAMSAGALRRVSEVASWAVRLDRLLQFYQEVIASEGTP